MKLECRRYRYSKWQGVRDITWLQVAVMLKRTQPETTGYPATKYSDVDFLRKVDGKFMDESFVKVLRLRRIKELAASMSPLEVLKKIE